MLTGASDPETAVAQLATIAPVAIVTLGADGAVAASSEGTVRVPAGGTERLTVPLRLDLVQMGSALFRMLSNGGAVDYGLEGNLSLTSAGTPDFLPAEMPFSASGRAELSSGASATR